MTSIQKGTYSPTNSTNSLRAAPKLSNKRAAVVTTVALATILLSGGSLALFGGGVINAQVLEWIGVTIAAGGTLSVGAIVLRTAQGKKDPLSEKLELQSVGPHMGIFGPEDQYPKYLRELSLENGEKIPLNSNGQGVQVSFNSETQFPVKYLPTALFSSPYLKDETIKLKWKNQMFEIQIPEDTLQQLFTLTSSTPSLLQNISLFAMNENSLKAVMAQKKSASSTHTLQIGDH